MQRTLYKILFFAVKLSYTLNHYTNIRMISVTYRFEYNRVEGFFNLNIKKNYAISNVNYSGFRIQLPVNE